MRKVILIVLALAAAAGVVVGVAWVFERLGPATDAPLAATSSAPARAAPASPEQIARVCEHLVDLGTGIQDCPRHLDGIARLDGPRLWALRRACMLAAPTLAEAYTCNRATHTHWPQASP